MIRMKAYFFVIAFIVLTLLSISSTENKLAQVPSVLTVTEYSVAMFDIPFYCLTIGNPDRVENIKKEFKDVNLHFVYPPLLKNDEISRNRSGASGMCKMIDKGLRGQNKSEPFQPFVIMEDDCSQYRPIPNKLTIPRDADLVYLGISSFTPHDYEYFERTTIQSVHKLFGMFSTHMILVCSATGANLITRATIENGIHDKGWDSLLARMHPLYNIYALVKPLVYQNERLGGHESGTKWDFESKKSNTIVKPFSNEHCENKNTNNYKNSIAYRAGIQ
jgi:hypothetical protein